MLAVTVASKSKPLSTAPPCCVRQIHQHRDVGRIEHRGRGFRRARPRTAPAARSRIAAGGFGDSAACWLLDGAGGLLGRRRGRAAAANFCSPATAPGRTHSAAPAARTAAAGSAACPAGSPTRSAFRACGGSGFGCSLACGTSSSRTSSASIERSLATNCRGVLSITNDTSPTWQTAEIRAPERIREFRSGARASLAAHN